MLQEFKDKKILVVDDDETFLSPLCEELSAYFEIEKATSIKEGLDFLKKLKFDILLFDLAVGHQHSSHHIEEIKIHSPNTPILIMTGNPVVEHLMDLINFKIDGIIQKPFHIEALLEKIHIALGIKSNQELEWNFQNRTFVLNRGDAIKLTKTENEIMQLLFNSKGNSILRVDIFKSLWPKESTSKNTLDTHIYNLKKKIPILENTLICIHGDGYYLDRSIINSSKIIS